MEDSGIDSEDRQSTTNNYDDVLLKSVSLGAAAAVAAAKRMSDLDFDVAFRGAHLRSNEVYAPTTQELEEEPTNVASERNEPPNTCRILQRKLELKVERAKRNYTQYQEEQATKSQSATLIPINRLPIPGEVEQKPLVDYQSQSSDEAEEISFFPAKLKHAKRQKANHELTDTFSIQEMTIESDVDSDDSGGTQNLELLLPGSMKRNILDKFKSCFGCFRRRSS